MVTNDAVKRGDLSVLNSNISPRNSGLLLIREASIPAEENGGTMQTAILPRFGMHRLKELLILPIVIEGFMIILWDTMKLARTEDNDEKEISVDTYARTRFIRMFEYSEV